jgi:hypothetical protein
MKGFEKTRPKNIPWKIGQIYLVTGEIKNIAAKMLASIGASYRGDLKFNVLVSFDIAKVDPEAVSLVIASDTLDPPKFCAAHKNITHFVQADSPRIIEIAAIKTGRVKSYVLAWGNTAEIAHQVVGYM